MARAFGVLFAALCVGTLCQLGNAQVSLPHSRRRDVLQAAPEASAQGDCAWNDDQNVCDVNPVRALGLVAKAPDSEMKDLIFDTVTCHFMQSKDKCVESGKCKWDKDHDLCELVVDVTEIDHFKRCVGDAAVFLESGERSKLCSLYETQDSCNIAKDCGWEDESKTCSFDIMRVLTGIPSKGTLPRGLEELLLFRSGEMADSIADVDLTTPEDVLDWTPPPFACPDGVDQVMCHVAQEADEFVQIEVYCAAKQAAGVECNEKGRCVYDESIEEEDLRCRLTDKLQADLTARQRKAYVSSVSSPTSIALLEKDFQCLDNGKATCTDDCIWQKHQRRCTMDAQFAVREMAKHPVTQDNASCELVKEIFASGCLQLTKEDCGVNEETKRCMWDHSDGLCIPGPMALSDVVFAKDGDLKAEAAGLFDKCQGIAEKAGCV